jgi:purine-binding chemotaxis protein CheW
MTTATLPAVAIESADALYGVFCVGATQVALPLSELREVIPCPSEFVSLPATAPGLVGAVNLRHLVIPVVDLRSLIGKGSEVPADVIVIVAREGKVFGLLANEIRGVSQVADESLMEMGFGVGAQALFTYSFERDDDTVVSVLDSQAIAALPGMPVVHDTGRQNATAGVNTARTLVGDEGLGTAMLVRCGAIGLSLDVVHVHSVIPTLTIHQSPLAGQSCLGVIHLNGSTVPVVDPLSVMGLGVMPPEDANRGIVVQLPRGPVVLTASDVSAIVTVMANDVLSLPPAGMPKVDFVIGMLANEAGQFLMIDGASLRSDPELDALAGLGMPIIDGDGSLKSAWSDGRSGSDARNGAADAAAAAGGSGNRRVLPSVRKFLTYQVGVEVATALEDISEILPYPDALIPLDRSDGCLHGVFSHRGTTVPLMCLSTLLGQPVDLDIRTSRVLLVGNDGWSTGFVVPALNAIEESIWEEEATIRARAVAAQPAPPALPAVRPGELVHALAEAHEPPVDPDEAIAAEFIDGEVLEAEVLDGEYDGFMEPAGPEPTDWYGSGRTILEDSNLVKIGTADHGRMLPDLDLLRLARFGLHG